MHSRVFKTEVADNENVGIESCLISCSSQNFSLARLEHDVQCCTFIVDLPSHHGLSNPLPLLTACGNDLIDGALTALDPDCQINGDGHKL